MINHKESRQVRMDSWLLQLLSRDMRKNKKQRLTNKQSQKIKEK